MDIKSEECAAELRMIVRLLEDRAASLGEDPKDILLEMEDGCNCLAGFIGQGSYTRGILSLVSNTELSKHEDFHLDMVEDILYDENIISEKGWQSGITGKDAEFYGSDDTRIPLSLAIAKLNEYAHRIEHTHTKSK